MTSFLAHLRMLFAVLFNHPIRVEGPRGAAHLFPRERLILPVMAGADGEGEGDDDGDGESDDEGSGDDSGSEEENGEADGDDGTEGDKGGDGDDWRAWKNQSRKHERRAKTEKKKREEAEAKLRKREEADKSDQEKAIDKARQEGESQALTKAEKERRSDRLEVAVTRLASKALTIGEGDDAKKVRFADSDDALQHIERAIARGEIDDEDIFDEGNKVKVDALKSELAELLESKPHYQARNDSEEGGKGGKRANGSADQGKGSSAGSKDLEDMSAEDHFKRIHRGK